MVSFFFSFPPPLGLELVSIRTLLLSITLSVSISITKDLTVMLSPLLLFILAVSTIGVQCRPMPMSRPSDVSSPISTAAEAHEQLPLNDKDWHHMGYMLREKMDNNKKPAIPYIGIFREAPFHKIDPGEDGTEMFKVYISHKGLQAATEEFELWYTHNELYLFDATSFLNSLRLSDAARAECPVHNMIMFGPSNDDEREEMVMEEQRWEKFKSAHETQVVPVISGTGSKGVEGGKGHSKDNFPAADWSSVGILFYPRAHGHHRAA
ncbi:hypothetical protein C8R42DRAFT_307099 [Lentinula raphanica]|nr:hypothetical protein C8R42DRAFT_307099 [Lentinula raphanica]